jgi:hypothetical protein
MPNRPEVSTNVTGLRDQYGIARGKRFVHIHHHAELNQAQPARKEFRRTKRINRASTRGIGVWLKRTAKIVQGV